MQDSLGELHDCDVWIAEIGAALTEASDEKIDAESSGGRTKEDLPSGNGTTRIGGASVEDDALLWLLDHFVKERTDHFRAALGRWREWKATGFQEQLVATIHNQPPAAEPPARNFTPTFGVAGHHASWRFDSGARIYR